MSPAIMPRKIYAVSLAMAAVITSVPLRASDAKPAAPHSLIDQYCLGCHNQKLKTAGVALDTVDVSKVDGQADLLERVLRKVRTGEMPPVGLPRPEAPVAATFAN